MKVEEKQNEMVAITRCLAQATEEREKLKKDLAQVTEERDKMKENLECTDILVEVYHDLLDEKIEENIVLEENNKKLISLLEKYGVTKDYIEYELNKIEKPVYLEK